ncbi:hypothetical protein [Bradyrhizobium sp. 2S1]|uniref:hypothetical protein n=1 Tax=Bradyrhizobium sp. 2S1 TaxID=1404429 RepID=UPI0015952450|nr:hypothetical protein [Bradyrhizobium sp. 2S1]MCK7668388.1 hypothetical protein [Bradyrhizobium sp. 2S1]
MFTPAFRQGSAPRAKRRRLRAPSFEAHGFRKSGFLRRYCTQSNAQMMRRDKFIVNEMEFRMLSARQLISPRSHRATMKGFCRYRDARHAASSPRLHQI